MLTNPKVITAAVFVLVYLWLVLSKKHRAKAIWLGIAALYLAGLWLPESILTGRTPFLYDRHGWLAVNWNVVGIFAGTLLIAEAFIYSRVPALLSDAIIDRSPNICWAAMGVCALSAFISIFVENVATVLIVAPIAMEMAHRQKVSPVPFIIGIAICSNLEGTATLIGDPPSMLLASEFRMNFNDFIWFRGRPGIFFAVQAGAAAGLGVLWLFFRRFSQPVVKLPVEKARGWVPTYALVIMIFGLALSSFVDRRFMWWGAALCMGLGTLCVIWLCRRDPKEARQLLHSYDWSTTFFLIGVFILITALENVGLINDLAHAIGSITGDSRFGRFFVIVLFSMLISAFIDNVPYLGVMLGVVHQMAAHAPAGENSFLLPFGLLLGACLGGNITPVGASANIVAYGMIRRKGLSCSFADFVKIGLPFTVAATAAGSVFLWLFWS